MSTLIVPAWRLRWRAPELALVLGERVLALAPAGLDESDRLKAEALVVFASNRIGRGVRIADRALDALKAAEAAGEQQTAWLLRIELAGCARSVGAPLTGFAAVRPVLEAEGVPYGLRAAALVEASECIVTVGRGDEPAHALKEADRLYAADTVLDPDTALLLRALLRAVSAAQLRRWGDLPAAIEAAREGLELLDQATAGADSGQARGRLTLELVCALMDAQQLAEASATGTPLLERPVRAPSASTSGWLRLALATRVHLPAGRVVMAREMLREAAASAERHQLDTLLAESLLALAHVHEVSGELAEALTNLRAAHAAERRRARAVYTVRARLAAEFSGVHREPASLHQQLADLLRADGGPPRLDPTLPAELKQQLRQWRPVQVRKGDGLKVKRVRRAAEDMTVEGLSAARAHAADRWRMVQPFGDPEDKASDPVDQQPSDRTVPAAGLIASAGAMISGRRRAARVAAGDIEDETPQPEPPAAEPAPEAPKQPESVLDMLKAAGLREGGRRRAPEPDEDANPQQWRVDASTHHGSHAEPEEQPPAREPLGQNFFEPTTATPDDLPPRPPRSAYPTAFGQEPAEPHVDLPTRSPGLGATFGRELALGQEPAEPHGDLSPRSSGLGAAFGRESALGQEPAEPHGDVPPRSPGLGAAFGQEPAESDLPPRSPGLAAAFGRETFAESTPDASTEPSFGAGSGLAAAFGRGAAPDYGPPADAESSGLAAAFSRDWADEPASYSPGLAAAFGRDTPEPAPPAEEPATPPFSFDPPPDFAPPVEVPAPFSFDAPAEPADKPEPFGFEVPSPFGFDSPADPPQPFSFDSRAEPAASESPFGFESAAESADKPADSPQPFSFDTPAAPQSSWGLDAPKPAPSGFDTGAEPTSKPAPFSFGIPAESTPEAAPFSFGVPAEPAAEPSPFTFDTPVVQPSPSETEPQVPTPEPQSDPGDLAYVHAPYATPDLRIPAPPEREPEPDPEPPRPKQPQPQPVPEPVPDQPVPDEVPDVPIPDEVPPQPDLVSNQFLSPADIEDEPEEPAKPKRKDSEMSLAELLAEALVAYETGRQEEQQTDPEKTGPIRPVETPDPETTGPIRPVGESYGGWTLPSS
ncbi:hypothetical protein [Lentzea sp. NBRC 105346]|uniref:hypothetical protein n=1 Tax=Lentzea sp. NBRC 105346 TaxID=3032205 RepID=UPI0025561D36|nr:hypothetical protein [Lentzea sp. NBRC 105346]